MQFSRRLWGVLALLVLFAVGATLLEQPVFLFAAGGLLAWVLTHGYRVVRAVRWLEESLVVDQTPTTPTFVDESRPFTVSASLPRAADVRVHVEARVPVAGDPSIEPVELAPGERAAESTGTLTWRVAGEYRLRPAAVHVSDRWDLLSTTFRVGETPTTRVDPPRPRDTYIAEGGASLLSTLGRRQTVLRGNGFDLGEVREYVPGDAITRIDWKATARLDDLHVREFESETSVVTTMILDARAPLHAGPPGATKFDYLRQVALALVGESRSSGEPIGLYVLDDEGVSGLPARATSEQYERLRRRLYGVETVEGVETDSTRRHRRSRGRARRIARALADDESTFARRVRPFLADTTSAAVESDRLYRLLWSGRTRTTLAGGGTVLTVVLTDDTNRAALRESVRLAQRRDGHVVVFLTPSALFDADATDAADARATYDRLREFDRFRRELSGLAGVSAFEVGPGSRLERVLREAEERRGRAEVR
jgi:uncharacterized protein (DUF58 family)